jgi:serine/threonine protein kinase
MVEDVFGILGTTLAGTFHVEEVIAEGGFGVVYRAEHVAFRAPVALKCLKIPGTISPSQSELFVENFREEAEILFHLSAQIPEVVRPLHADAMTLEDGTFVPYIAMEWVEGRPLDSIIIMREDDGLPPLQLRKVLRMLTPIAHALASAHHFQVPGGAVVSVTHCDLKPENILITERDNPVRAKILDFGIAKARDTVRQNVGRITESEQNRPFTPSYGAPEQWVPKRYGQSGPWTDVWGMALTIVECLTGRPPIDGDMHAMMGTALDKARRPTPRNEGAKVADNVEKVFEKALAVDPRHRYDTIESFWRALEDAAGVPSSFEHARRRRQDPGYDDESFDESAMADSCEFAGLEFEDPVREFVPPSHPGPGRGGDDVRASSGPHSPPVKSTPAKGSIDTEEFFLEGVSNSPVASEAPIPSEPPGGPASFDLDISEGAIGPPPTPSRPRAALISGGRIGDMKSSGQYEAAATPLRAKGAPLGTVQAAVDEPRSLKAQLKNPLILVGIGLALTLVDMALARAMGGTLALGPVRLRWIAAGLAAVGMVMAFWNLLGDKEE